MTTTNNTITPNRSAGAPRARPVEGSLPDIGRRASDRLLARITRGLWRRAGSDPLGRILEREGGRQRVRTDDDVLWACLQALSWNAVIPEGTVRLDVQQGRVTLTGTLRLPHERAAAELAIRDVEGVISVSNLVGLAPFAIEVGIADRIRAAVSLAARDGEDTVEVHVDGACVLLAGQVGSRALRGAAVAAAWAAPGVVHVIDEIVVKS
jgi:osmotically-inducible protein OsmY